MNFGKRYSFFFLYENLFILPEPQYLFILFNKQLLFIWLGLTLAINVSPTFPSFYLSMFTEEGGITINNEDIKEFQLTKNLLSIAALKEI